MLPSYRAWLARPLLSVLGYGAALSLACGGMAIDGEGDQGDSFGAGGSNFAGSFGGSGTAGGGSGGSGARGGAGGTAGSFSTGGIGGTGSAGFAGTVSFAGSAASFAGEAGSVGAAGSAGSASMEEPSLCVDLSAGLAGLPSQAFPADDDLASDLCGTDFRPGFTYQAICLPTPVNGQSCASFYQEDLVSLLYECGGQSTASFVCGPDRPLAGTQGCVGNECCYVLAGICPRN